MRDLRKIQVERKNRYVIKVTMAEFSAVVRAGGK